MQIAPVNNRVHQPSMSWIKPVDKTIASIVIQVKIVETGAKTLIDRAAHKYPSLGRRH